MTIQNILTQSIHGTDFLLLLMAMKLIATALTIGSGGPGVIFFPSVFIGATFGGAYGLVVNQFLPKSRG